MILYVLSSGGVTTQKNALLYVDSGMDSWVKLKQDVDLGIKSEQPKVKQKAKSDYFHLLTWLSYITHEAHLRYVCKVRTFITEFT